MCSLNNNNYNINNDNIENNIILVNNISETINSACIYITHMNIKIN